MAINLAGKKKQTHPFLLLLKNGNCTLLHI